MTKKNIKYYSLFLLIGFACNSQNENGQDLKNIEGQTKNDCMSNYEILKGTWQSSNFWNAYTEIEVADSLRCYVNHGDYAGPTKAEEYLMKNDSLFRTETGQRYQICIKDSSTVLLTDQLGRTYKWKRFKTELKIRDWSLDQDSTFDAHFFKREKEFNQ